MGNRNEVRVRGNAHQLLEKYKQLARDASMQGDRVTAEYYMQYADHYYRVLNEFRARQEEQAQRHQSQGQRYRDDRDDDYDGDEIEGAEPIRVSEMTRTLPEPKADAPQASRVDRDSDSQDGDEPQGEPVEAEAAPADEEETPRRRRSRSRGRPRREAAEEGAGELEPAEA